MPVLPRSQVRLPDERRSSPGPVYEPGLIEGIAANFRTAQDDQYHRNSVRIDEAYQDLENTLVEIGVDRATLRQRGTVRTGIARTSITARRRREDNALIFQALQRARQKAPKRFADIPETQDEFELWAMNRKGERQRDLRIADQTGLASGLTGGIAAAMTDPINLATLPFGGGGKSLGQVMIREGVAGLASEAVQQPLIAGARKERGEEFTATEAALNIAAGGGAGAILGGGFKGIGDNWRAIGTAPKAVQERLWGRILERNPELADRLGSKVDWDAIDDDMLPDITESLLSRENMTEAERALVDAARRDVEIDAANPFEPNGAGVEAFEEGLADALNGIMARADVGNPVPVSRGTSVSSAVVSRSQLDTPRGRLRGSSAISSRTVAGTGRDILKRQIGHVESSGGKNYANPKSSARGLYQFIDSTWLKYYKRRYSSKGVSDAQILAKRRDQRIQNILMDDLIADNARVLARAGIPESAGNLYLAHFAGSGGAVKLHQADPVAPVRAVLGNKAVNANSFLEGMTARDVINWAHQKMGQKVPSGGAVRVRDDFAEQDMRDALQREIDAAEQEKLRIDAELVEGDDVSDIVRRALDEGAEPDLIDDIELPDNIARDGVEQGDVSRGTIEPIVREAPDGEAEQIIAMDRIEGIVRDTRRSLNADRDKLARDLELTRKELDGALEQLAGQGAIRKQRNGNFVRRPVDPINRSAPKGPEDLLRFVARNGGLRDDAKADLGGIFETERKVRRTDELTGQRVTKSENVRNRLIPGVGPVLRPGGRGLDDMGELLFEAGYFAERPLEDDVLQMLTRASFGEKIFPEYGENAAPKGLVAADQLSRDEFDDINLRQMGPDIDQAGENVLGRELDLDEHEMVYREYWAMQSIAPDTTLDDAVRMMVSRELELAQLQAWEESGEEIYESTLDAFAEHYEEIYRSGTESGGRYELESGDPGPEPPRGGAGAGDAGAAEELGPIPADAYQQFDDPYGDGVAAVADSIEHDLRQATGRYGALVEEGPGLEDGEIFLTYKSDKNGAAFITLRIDENGTATIDVDGAQAEFAAAQGVVAAGANRFGPSQIRDAARQMKELYPSIKRFEGERLTGAGAGRVQQIEFATPTQDQARKALEQKGEGRQKSDKAQKPPGSDGGLFDLQARDQQFEFDAESGEARTLGDVLDELDEDARVLKDIEDCL